jgi:two-component system, cell cycle sensor histidine kinase and response regulator CckA
METSDKIVLNSILKTGKDSLKSDAKLTTYIDYAPVCVMIGDINGRHIEVNHFLERLLGYTRDELLKTYIIDLLAEESAEACAVHFAQVITEGYSQGQFQLRRKDGEVIWVMVRSARISNEQFMHIFQDISELKHAEESLRESEQKARTILNSSPAAIVLLDRSGSVLDCNDAFPKLLKITREKLMGKCIWDNFSSKTAEQRKIQVEYIFNTGESFVLEEGWKGTWYEYRIGPAIRNERGEIKAVVVEVMDITERKSVDEKVAQLQNKLLQAQKMESIGRLAGGVAHDFNNTLSVILGNAELALTLSDAKHPVSERLNDIIQAAERSGSLTRQLLAFARKQIISPTIINLNEIIANMLKMLNRLIGEDINLIWLPGEDLWHINMDTSQIDQIMANLCVNSRDAITGVGKLVIETRNATVGRDCCKNYPGLTPGEYVLLSVRDDGCGMNKETLDRMFEPFFTTKEIGKGTGLGLATVYGIVKQNLGYIYVDSIEGDGTEFNIYLPRYYGSKELRLEKKFSETIKCGRENILIVDDDPGLLKSTCKLLNNLGYNVLVASKPSDAVQLMATCSDRVHLLITDVIMPEMNGYSLAKNLTALYPNIKSLFMSGYSDDVFRSHGVTETDLNLIHKPFTTSELAAKVRNILENN